MDLNQTTLRGILAAILSVDQKYIVPKQGNWWNPQDKLSNISNWCAYRIKSSRPRTVPYYDIGTENKSGETVKVNGVCVEKISDIELQFVGPQAEAIANSVAMWPLRSDVQEQFKAVHGAIMYDDMTAIGSVFSQDGLNTIIAWNVTIRVKWTQIIDTDQSDKLTIDIGGQIHV